MSTPPPAPFPTPGQQPNWANQLVTAITDRLGLIDAAIAAAVAAGIAEEVYRTGPGKNLYNPADAMPERTLNPEGRDISSSFYTTTAFIPVTPGEPYTFSNARVVVFYSDADREAMVPGSHVDNSGSPTITVTAPAEAAFLRAAFLHGTYGDDFQIEKGTERTQYEPYRIVTEANPKLVTAVVSELPPREAELTPEDYGAVGDGVNDDTQAFVDAVTAGNGHMLALQSGARYRLTGPVSIDPAKIRGIDGNNALVVVDGDFTAFAFTGTHTGTANPSASSLELRDAEFHPIIQNVRVRGTSNAAGTAVSFTGTMAVRVSGSYFYDIGTAIHLTGQTRNFIIADNQIYHCTYGIHFDAVDLHQCIIDANHVSYCRKAIYADDTSIHNALVTGNDIECSTTAGYSPENLVHVRRGSHPRTTEKWMFTGNQFDDHYALTGPQVLMEMVNPSDDCQFHFVGNTFANAANGSIKSTDGTDVLIGHNSFKRCRGWNVDLAGAVRGVKVDANLSATNTADSTGQSGFLRAIATGTGGADLAVTANKVRDHRGQFITVGGDRTYNSLRVASNEAILWAAPTEPAIDVSVPIAQLLTVNDNHVTGTVTLGTAIRVALAQYANRAIIKDNLALSPGGATADAFVFPSAQPNTVVVANNLGYSASA